MTLTLSRLAEIEAAAAKATPGPYSYKETDPEFTSAIGIASIDGCGCCDSPWIRHDDAEFLSRCDPQTVLHLVKIARAAAEHYHSDLLPRALNDALRKAGLV